MKYPFRYISLIWRPSRGGRRICVGRIRVLGDSRITFQYDEKGVKKAKETDPHFEGYPGLVIQTETITDSEMLKSVFFRRLIKLERADRKDLLDFWLLNDELASDGIMLLAMTQGMSLSDMFEFIPVFQRDNETKLSFVSDLAGLSVSKFDISQLKIGERLQFEKEPENKYDPLAIKVLYKGVLIGHIKQVHNVFFKGKMSGIKVSVHRIDLAQTGPKLYMKVEC